MIFISVLCIAAVYTNIVSLPSEILAPSRRVVILVISNLDVQLDEPRALVELIHHTAKDIYYMISVLTSTQITVYLYV